MYIYLPIAEQPINAFIVLGIGWLVGIIMGMVGIGGGFLLTPLMIFFGIPSPVAVASVANQLVAPSVSGVLSHWKSGNVDFKMGTILLVGGVIGSSIGVLIFNILNAIGQLDLVIKLSYVIFLAIIGFKNAGIVVDNPATLVGLGDISSWPVLLAGAGFATMAILDRRKIPGAIIIGILAVSVIAWVFGISDLKGVAGAIPSPAHAFSLDFSLIATAGFIGTAFAFLFVDFMDTAGTLTSVANLTGKVNKSGEVEGIDRALLSDSVATTVGALAGTSNTTSYIESGAGVKEGGRTGLTAVTVAVLFLACLFFAPLAQSIPKFATAPALIFIATYFLRNLKDIDWDDVSEYAPAVLAAVIMPLTFSIAYGIAIGFIAYVVIKALSGKQSQLNKGSIAIAAVSLVYFAV